MARLPDPLPDPYPVRPVARALDATVRVPGSKSITNRALVVAALAEGTSRLEGVLDADDTQAMLGCLRDLGVRVEHDPVAEVAVVTGTGGTFTPARDVLDARMSGTTARFVLPLLALVDGPVTLDGDPAMRARPMGEGIVALRSLGAQVEELGEPGRLPVRVRGAGFDGGAAPSVRISGGVSSQFLSGLAMLGPMLPAGLVLELDGPLVSKPYVTLTSKVMDSFGARDAWEGERLVIGPGGYEAARYQVEPDASAASYPLAAAAVVGGRVRVEGLGPDALQGDIGFVSVLESMGAAVRWSDGGVEVRVTEPLQGVTVDMTHISDTAQTFAVVAVGAQGPSEVTGIGFIRAKETDRIAAVVNELGVLGIDASETPDGFRIRPGVPSPGVVSTYDDHRMAMSFALLGLAHPGISIADPRCVDKTFPGYWAMLEELRSGGSPR